MFKFLILISFLTVGHYSITAQQTGSFEVEVDFNEVDYDFDRTLYYYVPTDYDASQSYPLVVGFRGGPHTDAGQFRDQLTFLADSLGAIILCPENIDHFNTNEGLVKQLFKYSVAMAQEGYSIDQDQIYLTGLSFGGRHAVIVSMDTDSGEIPKLRGVIPFATGSNAQLEPDYESIDQFAPACICIGLDDAQVFINVANDINNDIQFFDGNVFLNEIQNVGHTVIFPTYPDEMMECFNYIEAQYGVSSAIDIPSQGDITIYPNPSSEILVFEVLDDQKPNRIYLSNLSGEIVKEISKQASQISILDLSQGIYILTVEYDESIQTTQFSVNR